MTARDCRICHNRGNVPPRDGFLWQPCPMCGDLDGVRTSAPPTAAHGAWDEPDRDPQVPWWKVLLVFGGLALFSLLLVGAVLLVGTPW